ncbi:MAG TPA: cytochrome c [Candidatus Acidoferrales bacterium]
MKKALALLLFVTLVIGIPAAIAAKGDAAKGKTLFAGKCAMCHGASGEGKEAMAKMLKVEIRHLGSKEVQDKTDAQLSEAVTKGTGKMKPVAGLKDQDVADIVAFIRTLKK